MAGYASVLFKAVCGAGLAILTASSVLATTIDVTIGSTLLNGLPAVLAFDFIGGGPPDNTVTLSALVSDGILNSTSTTGNVTGSGPWNFSDAGGSFFNELLVVFNPMGASLSFSSSCTSNSGTCGAFWTASRSSR